MGAIFHVPVAKRDGGRLSRGSDRARRRRRAHARGPPAGTRRGGSLPADRRRARRACPTTCSAPPTTSHASRSRRTRSTRRWRRRSRSTRNTWPPRPPPLGWPRHERPNRRAENRRAGRGSRPPRARNSWRTCGSPSSAAKPSCPTSCAVSRSCPRRSAGPSAKPRTRPARQLEAQLARRQETLAAAELDARLAQDRIDVTLPADPLPAIGRLHLITQHAPGDRGRVPRTRLQRRRRPRGRARLLQLRRAQLRLHPSLAVDERHVLHRADRRHLPSAEPAAARAHLAGPGPRDGEPPTADLHHRARSRLPAGLRRHAHAPVPPDRGPRCR